MRSTLRSTRLSDSAPGAARRAARARGQH